MTLPVYDRIAKQTYEKVKASKLDVLSPIKTPQWRLPSMLWNVEDTDPGELTNIEFYNKDGELQYTKDPGFYGWLNYNNLFNTFTTSGMDITSAIQLDAEAGFAVLRNPHPSVPFSGAGTYMAKSGETIRVRGTYNKVSGANNRIAVYSTVPAEIDGQDLVNGEIDYTYTFTADTEVFVLITITAWLATNFSFTNVSVMIDNGIDHFSTTASYIQDVGTWASGTYDTFTPLDSDIQSAIKTTAAGEAYCQNGVTAGTVPANIATDEVVRVVVNLTLNSGTAPKICLRNTGTGATISNIVTLANGMNYVILTATATLATGWAITIYNSNTELSNWSAIFTAGVKTRLPHLYSELTDEYFQYKGETLGILLPAGTYYMRFTTEDGHVYYSDYFDVDCIYPNLITGWENVDYNTFTSSDTEITSAIETGASGRARGEPIAGFQLINGESINVTFFLTLNSGALPNVRLYHIADSSWIDTEASVIGLNDITLTATRDGLYRVYFQNLAASNFSTSEVIVMRDYSEKYVRVVFSNTCDLGDIVYADGLEQTMWLESEPMENTFPLEEEGAKDGYAKFIRSFGRQDKKYLMRTKELPGYMADVIHRITLHDTVYLTDLVGDTNRVYNWDPEHEYLWEDKYYVRFDITFDYDEAFVIGGCCNNLT